MIKSSMKTIMVILIIVAIIILAVLYGKNMIFTLYRMIDITFEVK